VHSECRAGSDAKLVEDVLDVNLHGGFADEEDLANLCILKSLA